MQAKVATVLNTTATKATRRIASASSRVITPGFWISSSIDYC